MRENASEPQTPAATAPLLPTTDLAWGKLVLASDILLQVGVEQLGLTGGPLKTLRHQLVGLVEKEALPEHRQGRAGLSPPERARAGRALAALDDPRPGVGVIRKGEGKGLPEIIWCPVKPGKFWMGGMGGWQAGAEPFEFEITEAYSISKFPVTVSQFEAFRVKDGYDKLKYWTQAEAAGVWQLQGRKGRVKGRYDSEWRDRPHDYGAEYSGANQPVVGVTWWEAVAFCRWLSEQLGLPIRLPHEWEWERAARRSKGWPYPWKPAAGQKFQAGENPPDIAQRCNMAESGIGHTSAVGFFLPACRRRACRT